MEPPKIIWRRPGCICKEFESHRYQQDATEIKTEEDPKEIRRTGLLTAASEIQEEAGALRRLSEAHHEMALMMKKKRGKESLH
ncbi:MAG: hypothetical protein ACREJU_20930 [Nitrospiraceae bacterium]